MTNDLTVTSPKLYLDSNHVINIAKMRTGEPVDERHQDSGEKGGEKGEEKKGISPVLTVASPSGTIPSC